MLLIGCGQSTIMTQTKIINNKIPNELLILDDINKPNIKSNSDIIKAYIDLFESYESCRIKLNKIKDLNDK